jgi:hypothetical protein
MRIIGIPLLLLVPFVTGCGGDGLASAHGRVTCDGNAVEDGTIRFLPVDGKGPTAAIPIHDGSYEVRVAVGSKRVEIDGRKKVGTRLASKGNNSSPMVDDFRQYLPEKYNVKSELTAEIHGGTNELNYELHGAMAVSASSTR